MKNKLCEHDWEYKNTYVKQRYNDKVYGNVQKRYNDALISIFVCKRCQLLTTETN